MFTVDTLRSLVNLVKLVSTMFWSALSSQDFCSRRPLFSTLLLFSSLCILLILIPHTFILKVIRQRFVSEHKLFALPCAAPADGVSLF